MKLHCIDADLIRLCFETDNLVTHLEKNKKNDIFNFSRLDKHERLYGATNKIVNVRFQIKTQNTIDVEEFCKVNANEKKFKPTNGGETKKLKGVTKAHLKIAEFDIYFTCLIDTVREDDKFFSTTTPRIQKDSKFLQSTNKKMVV